METNLLDQDTAKAAAAELVTQSPLHRSWSDGAIGRCIHAAIETDQYLLLFEDDRPVGFISWAWLSPEKAQQYIANTHCFGPDDFPYKAPDDQLWFIDLIAPYGHVAQMCRFAKTIVGPIAKERGIDRAGIIRQRAPRRIGFFLHG